jgi:2-phospho-L-lactate guanylyltransferase
MIFVLRTAFHHTGVAATFRRGNNGSVANPVVAVPMKPFAQAKGRLAAYLDEAARSRLTGKVAAHVVAEALRLDAEVVVVTGDDDVSGWAEDKGARPLREPPAGGLDAAAGEAVRYAADREVPWVVVHGDLPLIRGEHLQSAIDAAQAGMAALAPSRLGGTNLIAASEPIEFRYGIGSFSRHLSASRGLPQRILVSVATLLDLDTPEDLMAAASLPGGEWLGEFLV